MHYSQIRVRDPFILVEDGKYYMFGSTGGSGFEVWTSDDLREFEGPFPAFRPSADFWGTRDFWAPEVHAYRGAYYMFASFISDTRNRGTAILRAERPEGPYTPWSDGAVTPADWVCLDGTLYIENGRPYIVFCHEWVQIKDGTICAMPLTDDLRAAAGEPVTLFSAKSSGWADPCNDKEDYVTDGPFLVRDEDGLWMFWSSFQYDVPERRYVEGIAHSDGGVTGPWRHLDPLFERDGGHGMVFRDLEGQLCFVLHRPNRTPDERPVFFRLHKKDGRWSVEER